MGEVFSSFNPPRWVMFFLNHPYLTLVAGISLMLWWINFKAKLEEKKFELSKEQANYLVIGAIVVAILIIKL